MYTKQILTLTILSSLIIVPGCASNFGNGGYFNRDNNTYSVMIGGAADNPKYSLQRGAYGICKKNHTNGGYDLVKNEWKYGEMGSSWIEGTIKCTGDKDKYLDEKFVNDKSLFEIHESNVKQYEKRFKIRSESSAQE